MQQAAEVTLRQLESIIIMDDDFYKLKYKTEKPDNSMNPLMGAQRRMIAITGK